ncbi:MAG: MBL fold metallo-hydrolase [Candidatus Cloacimonetes bacterium]|nr:MBL fold metallo-hydrolase [Candidatus Cloacimonadota bacterium]
MFQASVIASGSKGNCLLVQSDQAAVLFDVGISARRVWQALDNLGIPRKKLDAVVVSHEHSDHIKGAGAVARLQQVPIFITDETFCHCERKLGDLRGRIKYFESGKGFRIGDLFIHPFSSPHDAVDSCNFTVRQDGNEEAKLAIATDVGYASKLVVKHLMDATTLVLESNHDEILLKEGPYPWDVKQRISSRQGHLSNVQAVGVISQIMHQRLKLLVLAHLSEINNTPDHARIEMERYLRNIRSDLQLIVAEQNTHTPLFNI